MIPPRIDAVVSHHMNSFGSGVARFNEMLAQHLQVPRLALWDARVEATAAPLLSFKVGELSADEATRLDRLLDSIAGQASPSVFLHEYRGLALEDRLIETAVAVVCGNDEIAASLSGRDLPLIDGWAPGLIVDQPRFEPAEISVFSFGMAHKIRTDMFGRLRELLERSGRSYTVHISTATHETSSMEDDQLVFGEMHRLFPRGLYFLGHLSDVAVANQLSTTTFFAAFFGRGARANNTSLASAMEHGAVVITNLDEHSPAWLAHMDNVIDIERCDELPDDPLVLRRLSVRAMETARARSWGELVERLTGGR